MEGTRKIELQAPDDLTYLLANVRRAAAERLDEAFPPVDDNGGEDEMRTRIEKLVNDYINKTFTLAAPSLSINGFDVENSLITGGGSGADGGSQPPAEEFIYEPFDARKRERVEDLSREEEDLLRDIAHLKKTVPGAAASSWAEATRKSVKEDEEALAAANEQAATAAVFIKAKSPDGGSGDGDAAAAAEHDENATRALRDLVKGLERQEDVEKSYEGAVRALSRLTKEMGGVVARMERARNAGEYVVTEK